MNTAPQEIAASVLASVSHQHLGIAAREVEEDEIGRRIVEEGGEDAGQPEIRRRRWAARRGCVTSATSGASAPSLPGLQDRQHRRDGDEDAGEQLGDLQDRTPAESRCRRDGPLRRQAQRQRSQIASRIRSRSDVLQLERDVGDREGDAGLPVSLDIRIAAMIAAEQDEVDLPSSSHRRFRGGVALRVGMPSPCGTSSCRARKNSASRITIAQTSISRNRCVVVQKKLTPLQEAEEQRRIAERRQRAADVRHQEDEEHEDMDLVPPVVIGADHRADQQHRGAGRAHPARQHACRSPAGPCSSTASRAGCP